MLSSLQIVGVLFILLSMVQVLRLLFAKNKQQEDHQLSQEVQRAKMIYAREQQLHANEWTGFREFIVVNKVDEGGGIFSYYLKPFDDKPFPTFLPGQYLTFSILIPGLEKPITRCYSLSDSPLHDEYYRISVKKILPSTTRPDIIPGLASNHLASNVDVGHTLYVKKPAGHFTLDISDEKPAVMIAGGIGITPLLSMLNTVAETNTNKTVYFIYAVMSGEEHIMKQHLAYLDKTYPNIHLQVFYASPRPDDIPGQDYHHTGFVGLQKLQQILPSNNFEFYLCGPPPMLSKLYEDLRQWGVPAEQIHHEAFGPASIIGGDRATENEHGYEISYAVSDYLAHWEPKQGSILNFSESHGINLTFGCRSGRCGICMVKIKSGHVDYITEPQIDVPEGFCLPCISKPSETLEIEA